MATSNPSHHIFKPHFKQQCSTFLCKRNYKYINNLQIDRNKHSLKVIPKLKFISSLDSSSRGYRPTTLPLLEKLVKFHHKCIKNLQGGLENPRLQRLLPSLTQLNLTKDPAHWRLLTSRSAFTKLAFNFQDSPEQIIQNFLKYRVALSRNFPKMRALHDMKIKAFNKDTDLILSMLEMVNEKVHLESIKDFDLTIERNPSQDYSQPFAIKPVKINKVLERLTTLSIDNAERYSFLFSLAKFNNLLDLHLSYSPQEGSLNFCHFKDLPKLKKFALSFEAYSSACEVQFYENFIVPSTVEHLDLTLIDFKLNENRESMRQTFAKNPLNCCQHVRFLNLSLHVLEGTSSTTIGRFTSLFLQRFVKLEQFFFHAVQFEDSSSDTEDQVLQPLDLKDVWKGLIFLKDTLTSVSINSDIIAFPKKIDTLETGFPRLESLSLRGEILRPEELGMFCRSIPTLKHIILRTLVFTDEDSLKKFLLSWREVPRDAKINLCFSVEKIYEQLLINCLMEYLQEVRVRGMLKMSFMDVWCQDIKAFQGIFDLARKKGCFEEFSLFASWGSQIFQIVKDMVRSMREGLALSS